ncbi:energy transducer TonB [Gammaproteobacteria bacterium 42_54_T18]|nr:energy transducer TonB [Gammaproteobacteria bacterium 42_54_T18]
MNIAKTLRLLMLIAFSLMSISSTADEQKNSSATTSESSKKLSLDILLQEVKQGRSRDKQRNKQREAEFLKAKVDRQRLIDVANAKIAALEAKSETLESAFNDNETLVKEKKRLRDERLGSLKELFGHLTGAAGDMRSHLTMSITSAEFDDRKPFLDQLIKKMNTGVDLPSIQEIEAFWYELHREMTESGRVSKFTTSVGTQENREVVRVGTFNLISEGEYLGFDSDTARVYALPRQPVGYVDGIEAVQLGGGVYALGVDPTGPAGGGLLKALINTPTWLERWHQGKVVGYVISVVGCIGLLIALWRFLGLSNVASSIKRQLADSNVNANNALGRILKVAEDHPELDTDGLDLKLDEAILKERPAIEIGLPVLKIIAMVAPLLGLLGTVTGMIIVFQAITVYGAGDPKAMAGGISSALVTTVLGLIVAIPILLLHTLLLGKAKNILHILEEQSAGIIASRTGR